MSKANMIIFTVQDVAASARFYEDLLGAAPLESSPNFAMFALEGGFMLGLWGRHDVKPALAAPAGASELLFSAENMEEVEATCRAWQAMGVTVLQMPEQMDFGYTFTARDPDGHRLRTVYVGPNAV